MLNEFSAFGPKLPGASEILKIDVLSDNEMGGIQSI
jgi:hypothetical protein